MIEIATILGAVFGAVAKVVGDYVASPIKNTFSYLCCFNSNIQTLGDEIERLEPRRASVQQQVDAARRNVEVVLPEVEDWLRRVDEIKSMNDTIRGKREEIQTHCFQGRCTNLRLRYSLSREAKKTAKASGELRNDGQFSRISNPAGPSDLGPIPAKPEIKFDSRKAVEKQIMDALKDNNVYIIGIWGMGGIGKTTLVKKIGNRVIEEKLFDEVVMATVSQQPDSLKIQEEIAEGLGVKLEEKNRSDLRAKRLYARLKGAKRVLIILDDVWRPLKLEELGIPSPSSNYEELEIPSPSSNVGCKVILTSRTRQVLVDATKILPLEVLREQEAWNLFSKKAGLTDAAPDLHRTAEDVARECKGLPLALVTVGSALRDKTEPTWKDALLQLRRSTLTNFPEVPEDVYRPLQWSYDQLGSSEARYLLLLCCLFPEDSSIDIEDLVHYGVGLGKLSGVENLREARDRVRAIVELLKNRSLLMNEKVNNMNSVKIHDVIRDMAISIASKNEHSFWVCHDIQLKKWPKKDRYSCISLILGEDIDLPEITCPTLQALHMKLAGRVPHNFFVGMTELVEKEVKTELKTNLKVLYFEEAIRLPDSLTLLTNLHTLHLDSCRSETISEISKLVNLEILSLRDSDITELPKEIGELKKLMFLDLSGSSRLKRIAPSAVSGLVRLEELLLSCTFSEWEADIDENPFEYKANASLAEVASLKNLTTLMIHIPNPDLLRRGKNLWPELRRYEVIIGNPFKTPKYDNYEKVVYLEQQTTPLSDWIYDLLGNAEVLELSGESSSNGVMRLSNERFKNVKRLRLYRCNNLEYLASTRNSRDNLVFPIVESISLSKCEDLKEIFQGQPPAESFDALEQLELQTLPKLTHLWNQKLHLANLRSIRISECRRLEYVFPLSTLENLLALRILDCADLKDVFKEDGEQSGSTVNKIILPKLNILRLESLPSLSRFCKAANGIECPLLHNLIIRGSPNLGNFFPTDEGERSTTKEGDRSFGRSFLFNQKVISTSLINLKLYNLDATRGIFSSQIPTGTFSRLQILKVGSSRNMKTIFSPPIHRDFTSLYSLTIEDCSDLEEVILKEDEKSPEMVKEILFPSLGFLTLRKLPKMRMFCHMENGVELPSLTNVIVRDCPEMKTFCLGPFSTGGMLTVTGISNRDLATRIFSDKNDLLLM